MKKLILFLVVVVAMIAAGWMTFTLRNDRASVNIETQEIKNDTRQIVEEGKELVEDAGRSIENLGDESDRAPVAPAVPPSSPANGSVP